MNKKLCLKKKYIYKKLNLSQKLRIQKFFLNYHQINAPLHQLYKLKFSIKSYNRKYVQKNYIYYLFIHLFFLLKLYFLLYLNMVYRLNFLLFS